MSTPISVDFTFVTVVTVLSVVLSLVFQYAPILKDKYGKLPDNYQKLVMLGCLFVVSGVMFGLNCLNFLSGLACTKDGLLQFFIALVTGIVANQGVFNILPNPNKK